MGSCLVRTSLGKASYSEAGGLGVPACVPWTERFLGEAVDSVKGGMLWRQLMVVPAGCYVIVY